METIARFNGLLKHVTAALDIAKNGEPLAAVRELREQLTRIHEEMLASKEAVLAMQEKNLELADQLRQMQRFEADRDRYRPETLKTGSVVYVEKEVADGNRQPKAYLCAHCFERGVRCYLQPPEHREFHHDVFSCNECGYTANVPNDLRPVAMVGSSPKGGDWDDFV
jgi:hypothetical protein